MRVVIVPLKRMPLTPNGKVDKNALPSPDTALSTTTKKSTVDSSPLTELEKQLLDIWIEVLFPKHSATAPVPISIDDNFFDVGGHSILATRLIFKLRQALKLEGDILPLNLLFQFPTIRKMATEIASLRSFNIVEEDLTSPSSTASKSPMNETGVSKDEVLDLATEIVLPPEITSHPSQTLLFDLEDRKGSTHGTIIPKSIFLTGATGFLGAFICYHLLKTFPSSTVVCLVRAKNKEDAWHRLQSNMEAHLLWSPDESSPNRKETKEMMARTKVIVGDLGMKWLGIGVHEATGNLENPPRAFLKLADEIDCVVHNGAFVHWVYPYQKLKPANVEGTLEALKLCTTGSILKPFHFVSSTSVLDTEYYTHQKVDAVLESDDLEGSRKGLSSGYGQSKWVAEKILLQMRKERNLPITIIRPGYIVGDSQTGVTNTDDFLWRLCKGCIQLGQVPFIQNVVNMCPVDYVAEVIVAVVQRGRHAVSRGVFHVWNPHEYRFVDFFYAIQQIGYSLTFTPYIQWRNALTEMTLTQDDNALYPLLHFVLDDLPTSTKAPTLNWTNTKWVLEGTGIRCPILGLPFPDDSSIRRPSVPLSDQLDEMTKFLMTRYLLYLCRTGFLKWPESMVHLKTQMEELKALSRSDRNQKMSDE